VVVVVIWNTQSFCSLLFPQYIAQIIVIKPQRASPAQVISL